MKAYQCTRCDSFGASGNPESERCECDDVEDALRAQLAAVAAERDAALTKLCDRCKRSCSRLCAAPQTDEDIERDTAEAIAAWLHKIQIDVTSQGDVLYAPSGPGKIAPLTNLITSFAWRPK